VDALAQVATSPRVTRRSPAGIDSRGKCVVYRMRRAQRALDNPALEAAIAAARALSLPVAVFFGLMRRNPRANLRHYAFMLEGLADTAARLERRGIGFIMRLCEGPRTNREFARFCAQAHPALVVADENALRGDRGWDRDAAAAPGVAQWSVDADLIVPARLLAKEHFAARTIRPRIRERLNEFMRPVRNSAVAIPWTPPRAIRTATPSAAILDKLRVDRSVGAVSGCRGGTTAALAALREFVATRLRNYAERRNHPELAGTSRLSPYLHFGQIGPHTIALAVQGSAAPPRARDAFLEELIVRRELAANFTRHNPRYRNLASAEPWALGTLAAHRGDRRAYHYTPRHLEQAETHDELWNAAQRQMVESGWMHGYMRMYWAKKILEWSETPEAAYQTAVTLNDRYELDGRDPNGYAGVAWAIAGKHDRAWGPERPVYGMIRYMSAASTSRKFSSREYIEQWRR
jgi:deoxyribodipyrimidine photo-lyase